VIASVLICLLLLAFLSAYALWERHEWRDSQAAKDIEWAETHRSLGIEGSP
jgi:hypothetical protein